MATISLNPTTGQIELTPEEIAEIALQVPPGQDGVDGAMGIPGLPGPQGIQGIQGVQGIQGPPGVCPCNQPAQPDTFTTFINSAYKNEPPDPWQGIPKAHLAAHGVDATFTNGEPDPVKIAASLEGIDPPMGLVWYDIEHLDPYGDTPEQQDALRKLMLVISLSKAYRPDLKFGYYGVVPPRDYWGPVGGDTTAWELNQSYVEPLRDLVDVFFPSIYAFYAGTSQLIDDWETYARANIGAVQGYGKPIYPFIWPSQHPSGDPLSPYLGDEYMRRMLDVCYDTANGVVIWGAGFHNDFPNRDEYIPDPDWFQVLQQFYTDNGLGEPMSLALKYDFVNHKTLVGSPGPTLTCTRASDATYFDSSGVMQTASSNVARFDHDPVTLASLGLLVEEARTNLCLYSGDTSNAAWVASNMTKESTSVNDPTGTANTTCRLTAAAANATLLQTVTSAIDDYSYSVYMKRVTGTGNVDLTADNGSTWTTKTLTAAWTRFDVSDASETNPVIGVRIVVDTDAIDFWGSQLEKNTIVPSSYIQTTTVAVPREKDYIKTTDVTWLNAAAGTAYCRASQTETAAYGMFWQLDDGTNNERIGSLQSSNTFIYSNMYDGAAQQWDQPCANGVADGVTAEHVMAWELNNCVQTKDGQALTTTDTTATIPTVTQLVIGARRGGDLFLNGYIKEFRYYNERLDGTTVQNMSSGVFPSVPGGTGLSLALALKL